MEARDRPTDEDDTMVEAPTETKAKIWICEDTMHENCSWMEYMPKDSACVRGSVRMG